MNRRSFIGILSSIATFLGFKQTDATERKSELNQITEKYGPYELTVYHDLTIIFFKDDVQIASVSPMLFDYRKSPYKLSIGFVQFSIGFVQTVYDDPNNQMIKVLQYDQINDTQIDIAKIAQSIQDIRNKHLGHD